MLPEDFLEKRKEMNERILRVSQFKQTIKIAKNYFGGTFLRSAPEMELFRTLLILVKSGERSLEVIPGQQKSFESFHCKQNALKLNIII